MFEFKWIDWNLAKIGSHNIGPAEAEQVVNHPFRGFPRNAAGKFLVWGTTSAGEYVQVVYVIEPDDRVFVIHARPLSQNEKRQARRRK